MQIKIYQATSNEERSELINRRDNLWLVVEERNRIYSSYWNKLSEKLYFARQVFVIITLINHIINT